MSVEFVVPTAIVALPIQADYIHFIIIKVVLKSPIRLGNPKAAAQSCAVRLSMLVTVKL